MSESTQSYERWMIERVDTDGKRHPAVILSEEDVDDVVDKLIEDGMDCYVHKVTIH